MTREELIAKLIACADDEVWDSDPEQGHMDADKALLDYIDDPEVTEAFGRGTKWYS